MTTNVRRAMSGAVLFMAILLLTIYQAWYTLTPWPSGTEEFVHTIDKILLGIPDFPQSFDESLHLVPLGSFRSEATTKLGQDITFHLETSDGREKKSPSYISFYSPTEDGKTFRFLRRLHSHVEKILIERLGEPESTIVHGQRFGCGSCIPSVYPVFDDIEGPPPPPARFLRWAKGEYSVILRRSEHGFGASWIEYD